VPPISYDEAHSGYNKPMGAAPAVGGPGPYDLLPAQPASPSHLSPELAAKVNSYQLDHYAGPVCDACLAQGARELYGGRCRHRPPAAERARQAQWDRKAAAVRFVQAQAAGLLADVVPVYGAHERDPAGRPPVVDRVSFLP
jgi:hypothetical protein